MSNDLHDYLERIAVSLEGILEELKAINKCERNENKKVNDNASVLHCYPEVKTHPKLKQFFEEKGYRIFRIRELENVDSTFVLLANNMGSAYPLVEPLIKEIKRNLAKGQQFTLCVREYSAKAITAMCGLATTLKNHGFLKEYFYKKSPHCVIVARPENSSKFHDFYTGHWLEYYVANVVRALVSGRPGARSINLNAEVRDRFEEIIEFDVLATLRDEVFWIECKTGEYKKYIEKYEKIAKKLGMGSNHVFLVIAGIDDATVKALNESHSITICNVEGFKTDFENSLNNIIDNE